MIAQGNELYPSSASDAAADDPARPVPTTIIVYFRCWRHHQLELNRWTSHFFSIGPVGIFASSAWPGVLSMCPEK